MNAKQELLKIVDAKKLTILKIDVTFQNTFTDKRKIIVKHISSLNELDFNCDTCLGIQNLFGHIYCKDSNNRPVWLTRGMNDGREWWDINILPEFYDTIK